MAIETPKSISVTGFLPFDLADLQDIWTNLNDGNYFSAFKKGIRLLDSILNASNNVGVGKGLYAVDPSRTDEAADGIEKWCELNADAEHEPHALKTGEPNLTAVPIADIVSLLRTLMQFYRMWKDSQPATVGAAKGTKFGKLRGNPPVETSVVPPTTPAVTPTTPTVANTQVPPVNPAATVEAAKEPKPQRKSQRISKILSVSKTTNRA